MTLRTTTPSHSASLKQRSLALVVAAVLAQGALAQPGSTTSPAANPPTSPAVAPITAPDWSRLQVSDEVRASLAPGPALVSALRRAAMFSAGQPTAQRITLTHRSLASSAAAPKPAQQFNEVQSQTVLRMQPPIDGKPAAFRIDAGNLILSLTPNADGASLVAVNTLNTDLFWQRDIAQSTDDLWSQVQVGLPPLALPTLAWGLQGEAEFATWTKQLEAEQLATTNGQVRTRMPLVGTTTWQGVSANGSLIVGDNCVLRVDSATGQPIAAMFDLSASPGSHPLNTEDPASGPWLLVQMEFLSPPSVDAESIARWQPALANRTRVVSMTDLVAKPAEISVGSPVPVLALLDADLRGWSSLDEHLEAARAEATTPEAERERATLLVVFEPSDDTTFARAREAALAAEAVQRTLNLRVLAGKPLAPRVLVASIAAMELEEMKADRVKSVAGQWSKVETKAQPSQSVVTAPLVFSSGGKQLLSRFAARSRALLVVLAADGTLIRCIPLDERTVEREALARELLSLVPDAANVGRPAK